jgi:hypothetical protein
MCKDRRLLKQSQPRLEKQPSKLKETTILISLALPPASAADTDQV